jgi:hypothetical protein
VAADRALFSVRRVACRTRGHLRVAFDRLMQDREGQQGLVGLPAAMISTAFSASDQRLGGVQGPTLASPLRTRAPASLRVLHERGPEVGAEPVWSVMVCRLLLARPGCQVVFRAAPGHPTTTLPCIEGWIEQW